MRGMELKKIINLMNDVQIAALGDKDPQENPDEYISDVNKRIGEVETSISLLKHELKKQGLNDW
jgi:hypothetical protein